MKPSNRAALLAAGLLACSFANAQSPVRPAAPVVTVGAELKQLVFDWEPVAGATYYELLQNADGASGFSPVGTQIPATTTQARLNIAVHLQHWADARYMVSACNAAGCHDSAEVFPRDQMLDAIGYLKASNADLGAGFGFEVELSLDGNTLVVGAPGEASISTGVNGNQARKGFGSGAAYVFRRVGGHWRQDAFLKPGQFNPPSEEGEGGFAGANFDLDLIALNENGSLVSIGAPLETTNGLVYTGSVYTYRRTSDDHWILDSRITAPSLFAGDFFGTSVDMSADGRRLKVTSFYDDQRHEVGVAHIYRRILNGWQFVTTVMPFHQGDHCENSSMSGDGNTLVQHCYSLDQTFHPTGARFVTLKRRSNNWERIAEVPLIAYSSEKLAISYDGTAFALHVQEHFPVDLIKVYRWKDKAWSLETNLDVSVHPSPGYPGILGYALDFNRAGTLLAVGALAGHPSGAGVSESLTPLSDVAGGAVLLYQRRTNGTWNFRSQITAPNPDDGDEFGESVSLCGAGRTLAVGAPQEDSFGRGIDSGLQEVNSLQNAGAAYLY